MQDTFNKLPRGLLLVAGLIMVALLGWIDYLTGDYSLLIFYALPVAFEAWFLGRLGAITIGLAAGVARFVSDYISYSGSTVRYWNSLQDMIFLLVVGFLIATVKGLIVEDQHWLDR